MNPSREEDSPDWAALCSQLDEAMNELAETDRNAILLRFFQRMDFRALGVVLKTSEDAAQKRVSRALEKLRLVLIRRGVVLSAATLGTMLGGQASAVPPQGLVASIAARATTATHLLAATVGGGATTTAHLFKTKIACGAGVLLVAAISVALWPNQASRDPRRGPGVRP